MTSVFGKIGVLAGGPSNERQISLKSGRAVYDALIAEKLDAVFLDVTGDIASLLEKEKIGVAFIALHGKFGEDGQVQNILEGLRIPYTGSGVEASRLALDKIASRQIFMKNGIPVPRYKVLEKERYSTSDFSSLSAPMVVKPQLEGSSIGLSIVKDKQDLESAVDKAFQYGDKIVVEEYIDGREFTVGILDEKPLPVVEIVTRNKVYDFDAKYNAADTKYVVPAPLENDIYKRAQGLGLAAHRSLGCRSFSRVDIMMDDASNFYVLEVNTIPGMTERSLLPKAAAAEGLSFGKLCVKLIANAVNVNQEFKYAKTEEI